MKGVIVCCRVHTEHRSESVWRTINKQIILTCHSAYCRVTRVRVNIVLQIISGCWWIIAVLPSLVKNIFSNSKLFDLMITTQSRQSGTWEVSASKHSISDEIQYLFVFSQRIQMMQMLVPVWNYNVRSEHLICCWSDKNKIFCQEYLARTLHYYVSEYLCMFNVVSVCLTRRVSTIWILTSQGGLLELFRMKIYRVETESTTYFTSLGFQFDAQVVRSKYEQPSNISSLDSSCLVGIFYFW